jgi:hypothetical protein
MLEMSRSRVQTRVEGRVCMRLWSRCKTLRA